VIRYDREFIYEFYKLNATYNHQAGQRDLIIFVGYQRLLIIILKIK